MKTSNAPVARTATTSRTSCRTSASACSTAPTRRRPRRAISCSIGYTAARVLHSVFYLRQLQPWRTLAFGVAQILMLVMLVSTFLTLL